MIIASGDRRAISLQIFCIILELVSSRSDRDIPGFLARPAVITTISESLASPISVPPEIPKEKPSTGALSTRSRALPAARPS